MNEIEEREISAMGQSIPICLQQRETPGESTERKWFVWVKDRPGIWEANANRYAAITALERNILLLWEDAPIVKAPL